MFLDQKDVETILSALGEQLKALAAEPLEFLVCGGSALNVLGLVQRATKDVDILAYVKGKHFDDLLALNPAADELEQAALWSMTHDVSKQYRQILKELLSHIGHGDVAEKL